MEKYTSKKWYKDPLFLLTVITIGITIYLVAKQFYIGVPYYDVFVYLNNALIFSGIPIGNMSVIYLSPLMPFLTSLVFRAGYISENVIFILNGILFILGVIGLYLLFKERFNVVQSFVGSLIFISLPLIFTWAASGGIDVPGVVFSIWAVYFMVLGVKKDSKYLYIVFPMLAVAFLARYTALLMVFPIFLYLLINKNIIKNFKKLALGMISALALITPLFFYIYLKLGNLTPIINIATSTILGSGSATNDLGYNPDPFYFSKNILNYISVGPFNGPYNAIQNPSQGEPSLIAYIIAFIVVVGLLMYIYHIFKKKFQTMDFSKKNIAIKNKNILFAVSLTFLLIGLLISFFTTSYIITELVFLGTLYFAYLFLKDSKIANLEFDFLFLSWFMAFFIFHSTFQLKVDRYFITMTPALTYFIILGLGVFINGFINNMEKFKLKINHESLKSWGLFLIVGVLLLSCTTATHIGHSDKRGYVYYMNIACEELISHDPNYQDKIIYSDYDPALTWLLKKEVKIRVPRISGSPEVLSKDLQDGNADYYIDALTDPKWEIPGYHRIKGADEIAIYEKDQ